MNDERIPRVDIVVECVEVMIARFIGERLEELCERSQEAIANIGQ